MSATETQQDTSAKPRSRNVLRKLIAEKATTVRLTLQEIGDLLIEARGTFGEKENDQFLTWAMNVCNWNRAMVYRVQQAARVVKETPQANGLGDIAAIAHLDRVPADKRARVIKEAGGTGANKVAIEKATAKVLGTKPRNPQGDAEKVAKRVAGLVKKHGNAILVAYAIEDRRTQAIAMAKQAVKCGGDAPKVFSEVLPENETTEQDS